MTTTRRASSLLLLVALPLSVLAPGALRAADEAGTVKEMLLAGCDESLSKDRMAALIPGSTITEDPLVGRGAVVGWERRITLPGGGEIRVRRIAPGGRLRQLTAAYWEPGPRGSVRPRLAALADGNCVVRAGRRLLYTVDSEQPVAVETLDGNLAGAGVREPLNPPVPDGTDPGGVPVALVDSGVNYLLPEIGRRLARRANGRILGYDYWDLDARPFDANPAQSPFFPQRHGTRTGSLLLHEAPEARLVPYRYPRPDMSRMSTLVNEAADAGIVVVNLSLGSNDPADWKAFADAAAAHPDMLFVVSAGNDGRDIDASPVYPAVLPLDNIVTVTSSEDDGTLAPGSNWGRQAVDLLVPAERLPVTDFDGSRVPASGASYAAVRISALAARLLASNPGWRAPQLRTALLTRALPPLTGVNNAVAGGFMPRPDKADRLPPMSSGGQIAETDRYVIDLAEVRREGGAASRERYLLKPTFVLFESTAWTRGLLERHARHAASVLAQCGVLMPVVDVRVLAAPAAYRYFHEAIAKDLVHRFAVPRPAIYFVRDTLQRDAYDAEAIGRGNSEGRPSLRDTVWITEETRDAGIALAHEVAHVLMDSGSHVDTSDNLMQSHTTPGNSNLDDAQCDVMVRTGSANGLLAPAPES